MLGPRPFAAGLAALAWTAACYSPPGKGRVDAFFGVIDCRRSGDRQPSAYGYDAGGLISERYFDTLTLRIQQFPVLPEETDELEIRLPDVRPLRATDTRPIVLRVGTAPDQVNASLSLIETCPSRPTLIATTGTLSLSRLTLAADPQDAGNNEAVAGTLTASVVAIDTAASMGSVRASFDFIPANRPFDPLR